MDKSHEELYEIIYKKLFKRALCSQSRIPRSELSEIEKRKDRTEAIPLLFSLLAKHIRRKGGKEADADLTALNLQRSRFLRLRELSALARRGSKNL